MAGWKVASNTAVLPAPEDLLPLVDARILRDLEDQLQGPDLARRFARDYAGMWDGRRSRLAAAIAGQDQTSALDAAISLRTTSAMVGGLRLTRLAEMLEGLIRKGDFGRCRTLMKRVAAHGDLTVSELRAHYLLTAG
ncbi:MAG: Hpt domain-containing protein [Arthrobacter sp.]